MTKKKVLSILLIICMLMSLMPTFAFADENEQPGTTGTTEVIEQSNDADDKGTTESKEQNVDENNTSGAPAGDLKGTEGTNEETAPSGETQTEGEPAVKVAKIGDVEYESLAEAVEAAEATSEITLLSDVTEDVTIPKDKVITLDLAGHTLTNVSGHTITNNGTLTINDSASNGVISCPTKGKSVLQNEPGATATLNGGKLYKNRNEDSNDYYVITNHGKEIIINAGVEIRSDSVHSSAIENGWYTASANSDKKSSKMIINGGTIASGGLYTVKNDDYGVLEINGGEFTNIVEDNGCVLNWNEATITGGKFNAKNCSVATMATGDPTPTYDYEQGKTTITGGEFIGGLGTNKDYGKAITVKVSGGYFTSDPTAYLVEGKVTIESDKAGYNFMVGDKPELPKNVDVDVAVAEPETKVPETIIDKDEVEKAVKNVEIPEDKLAAAAGTQANKITKQEAESAVAALNAEVTVAEDAKVLLVVQPYMEIEAVSYTKEGDNAVLTLNITPMFKTVATTASDASNIELGEDGKNAVVVGEPQKLQVTAPVEITIPLPTGFGIDANAVNAYVKHIKDNGYVYYHIASVAIDDSTGVKSITFTNDKGFSTFEVSGTAPSATVKFEGNSYKNNSATYNLNDAQDNTKLPIDTKSGYIFDGWTFEGINGTYSTLDETLLSKLAALTGTIKATPVFHSNSSGGSSGGGGGGGSATVNYTITATAGEGGKISPSDKVYVTSGSNKTFTITANAGYMISDVLVDGESVGAVSTYTFEKVTKAHTIKAEFTKTDNTGLPFIDVSGSDWFYAPVKYVYDQKLMVGVADNQFGPYTQTTRGMIVTMLWRMAGEPKAQTAADFTDVAAGDWYAKAIDWAAEKGVVNGYGDGAFGPNDPITREQLAAIFCNYAKANGKNVSARADLSAYSDQPSPWAESAMQWAVAEKLISGKGNGVLDPTGQATRAEAAAILMRYVTTFGK